MINQQAEHDAAAQMPSTAEMTPTEKRLWRALKDVLDPEFPVSIIDMGMVYGLQLQGKCVRLQLTFTAMGCPCMEMILQDIRERLLRESGIEQVKIDIVWDPPWTRERLSEAAIEAFRTWGVTV